MAKLSLFDGGGGSQPIASNPQMSDSIFEKAVVLSLQFHRLGTSRTVASGSVTSDADKDYLRISKDILKSPELEAIQKHDGITARMVRARSIPSLFKSGMYLVGLVLVPELDEILRLRINERQGPMLNSFMAQYDLRKTQAERALNSLYDPRDYPARIVVESKFSVEYSFIEFGAPGKLASINPELLKREQEKIQGLFKDALEEGVKLLRLQMADLVDHMIDRLKPEPDGKKKIFRDTLTENIDEFLRLFNGNNLAGDAELQSFVEQARGLMRGVDSEVLRRQDTVRDRIVAGFEQIKTGIDGLIVDRPGRKFRAAGDGDSTWGDL